MNTGLVKNTPFAWNGSGHREYKLVIYPDAVVYEKIMAEKQRFFMNYGVENVTKAFPYIMVAGFYAGEGMEETLIRWIQRICSQHNSFDVTLNNYSGFPQHHLPAYSKSATPATTGRSIKNARQSCSCHGRQCH